MVGRIGLGLLLIVLSLGQSAYARKIFRYHNYHTQLKGPTERLFPYSGMFEPSNQVTEIVSSSVDPSKVLFIETTTLFTGGSSHGGYDIYHPVRRIWAVNREEETRLPERIAFESGEKNPLAKAFQLQVSTIDPNEILVTTEDSSSESSLWSFRLDAPMESLIKLTTFPSYNNYEPKVVEALEDLPGYAILPNGGGYGLKRIYVGKSGSKENTATPFATGPGTNYIDDYADLPGTNGLAVYLTSLQRELAIVDVKHPEIPPTYLRHSDELEEINSIPNHPGLLLGVNHSDKGYDFFLFRISREKIELLKEMRAKLHNLPQVWHDGRLLLFKKDGVHLQTIESFFSANGGQ